MTRDKTSNVPTRSHAVELTLSEAPVYRRDQVDADPPYVRPVAVPSDGRPRRLEAGWFVAFQVVAPDRSTAVIQARIQATLRNLRYVDVANVTYLEEGDSGRAWNVELQVEAPATGDLGL